MCAVLNISPKTYYKYRSKEDLDYYDYLIIKEIFDENKRTYGYRRIVDGLLQKYGVVMNGKKVLRIMKKYNLMAEYIWLNIYERPRLNIKMKELKIMLNQIY